MSAPVLISIVIASSALAVATAILLWSFYSQGRTEDMDRDSGAASSSSSGSGSSGSASPPGLAVNVPTRGEPPAYEVLGTMYRTGDGDGDGDRRESNQVLPLYGRQTYQRAARWNYYTVIESGVAIPLIMDGRNCTASLGCSELYDDDEISIPDLGATYRVRMYKSTKLRYIPY